MRSEASKEKSRRACMLANRQRYRDRRPFLEWLKDVACADCGGRFPSECMDFDHVGPKRGKLSAMFTTASLAVIQDELEQCEIVCSNCHRIRTRKRLREGMN